MYIQYKSQQRARRQLLDTRSSAIAEGPRDASCQLKSCQLPRNNAETICTTSTEPSISCRYLTRATKSCCRQRLTICAINYNGRASELGGIIDLVDRRRPSLSRCERPPLSSWVDNTFRRSICRSEIFQVRSLGQSSRGKCFYIWKWPHFLLTQCRTGGRKLRCQKPARFVR